MKTRQFMVSGVCFCGALYGQMLEMPVPIVAGHPFSADEVTPRQLSSNLNSAVPETSRVYRDSAGRIRIDTPTPSKPGAVSTPRVFITDTVAGFKYVLNPDTKTARRSSTTALAPPNTDDPWKVERWGFSVPGVVETSPSLEPLATQLIGRLTVEGRRITNNIPKTEHSEAQDDVNEVWYSPELQMMVLRQVHHTNLGESTTRLENIDRSEPAPLLFQVPPEYTIEDWPPKRN